MGGGTSVGGSSIGGTSVGGTSVGGISVGGTAVGGTAVGGATIGGGGSGAIRDAGGLPVVHAENWDIITTLIGRNLAAGRNSPHWHPRSRPPEMEAEATGRIIDIATLVGVPLHIFHVSCAATAERIAAAKARNLPVYGETCPQYLYLTDELYDRPAVEGTLPVCSPPLRSAADNTALWEALLSGGLDLVSTDHCPFTTAEKATGLVDFSQIPGGVPSIVDLRKGFAGKQVLAGVSLKVMPGESLVIIGGSGTGRENRRHCFNTKWRSTTQHHRFSIRAKNGWRKAGQSG